MTQGVDTAIESARLAARAGDLASAWAELAPHRGEVAEQLALAWAWLALWQQDPAPPRSLDVFDALADAWPHHPRFVELHVRALTSQIEGRVTHGPVPDDDPAIRAAAIARRCLGALDAADLADPDVGGRLWAAYAGVLRLAGPAHELATEAAYARALATSPDRPEWLHDRGLFEKHRGRWTEALQLFRRVRDLGGDDAGLRWNLAIAATAVGEGPAALDAWLALGYDARPGGDGLPVVADLGKCRVRLWGATPEDVWVRSISPVHGIVLDPTWGRCDADCGDLVLWDGSPIAGEAGSELAPLFPLLARLREGGVRKYPFVAVGPGMERLEAAGRGLPDAVWIHRYQGGSPAGFAGALIVEPESDPAEAVGLFEAVLAELAEGDLDLAIPELHAAVGDEVRAAEHRERWPALERRLVPR